jgi:hypothetical protein
MHRANKSITVGWKSAITKKLKKCIMILLIMVFFLLLPIESFSTGLKILDNKGTVSVNKEEGPMPPTQIRGRSPP